MSNALLFQYDKDHAEYIQSKDPQSLLLMLKRISHSQKIPYESRSQPLLRLLSDSADELMLNSLEISVFYIFLERFGWVEVGISLHFLLLYIGLSAKKSMGAYTNHIQEHFNKKIKNFEENFRKWEEHIKRYTGISLVEINEAYNHLLSENFENVVNYNFYVDEILQISPPYQIEGKDFLREHDNSNREDVVSLRDRDNSGEILDEIIKSVSKDKGILQGSEGAYSKINSICREYLVDTQTEEIIMSGGGRKKKANSFLVCLNGI
ncbi:hypothetical protein SteCoe_36286 [Stentor coeruleus]|uniref:Uncharacterized protein n=1 Tax=Stentor coeruleus TaxID=5963 RepID=A0A1R2AQG5_9CILI|nr:hypothetical protein SteCoe_36286 [Stentor coeruleus]